MEYSHQGSQSRGRPYRSISGCRVDRHCADDGWESGYGCKMFAETGMWDEADKLQNYTRNKGLKKMAEKNTIEINGSMSTFYYGDDCWIRCEDINHLSDHLSFLMKIYDDTQLHSLM
ncbi:hypothetical protein SAY86_003926 [Trapa natans]|uniref:Uncharacterized protein n=1 Tax=Trapa natans TaxID=22666 RepID=A0AAN7RF99_TRANT|nr:hypothetical protein SAY86_003926 [Trapa natans]